MDKDSKDNQKELNELKTRVALLEKMVLTLMTTDKQTSEQKRKSQLKMQKSSSNINRVRRIIY